MKRLKIFKAYFVLWLFVYFIAITNLETFKLYFMSTLTFNIAIVSILAIGTFMLLKAAKDLTMVAGTFGVIMYKKGDISFYLQGIEKIFPSTIARKIEDRAKKQMLYFTRQEADDILAWLEETYANQNKYNNFFTGTVLMIGLLGTFAGLLGSISSMGNIVSSLAGNSVDIGKIMAGFSKPLSSMAVGFGSSLFGVISAVLLGIMGYILNKSQASLLLGVENWLQSRIVEESLSEVSTVSDSVRSSPTMLDLFLEHLSELSSQIANFATQHQVIETKLEKIVNKIEADTNATKETFQSVAKSFEELTKSHKDQTLFHYKVAQALDSLQQLQQKESYENSENFHHLKEIVHDFQKREDDLKIGLFNIVEAIEGIDKRLKQRDDLLKKMLKEQNEVKKESNHYSTFEGLGEFMKKHLSTKEES